MNTEDRELLIKLQNQDTKKQAFESLLDRFQEPLYWHIRKIVGSHENANDALQETLIRIWRGLPNFEGRSRLSTWLYRIAHNEALRFLKYNSSHGNIQPLHDAVNPNLIKADPYFDGDQLKLDFISAINKLTPKQRHVFQMKYFDELSFREIAEILEVKENTLKSSYYSAVKRIEKYLKSELTT